MIGQQDDDVVIVVVVWSSPTSSVRSAYASCHLVNLLSPALSRLVEDESMTTGTWPSLLILAKDALCPMQ